MSDVALPQKGAALTAEFQKAELLEIAAWIGRHRVTL